MFMAMGITEDTQRYYKLYHYLGATRNILKKLDNNGIANKSYNEAKTALDIHFCPKRNNIFLLNQLHNMKQEQSESMDNFYMRVKSQVQLLKLDDLSGSQIAELLTLAQLVNCTNEPLLRTKALKDNLKLRQFLDHARAFEMANKQAREIAGPSASVKVVKKKNFNNRSKQQEQKQSQTHQREQPENQKSCCFRCGKTERHPRHQCPARNSTCHKCGTLGHYATVCLKSKSSKKVQRVVFTDGGEESFQEEEDDAESNESYTLNINSGRVRNSWKIKLWIGGNRDITFRIDTGADVTVIPSSYPAHTQLALQKRHGSNPNR